MLANKQKRGARMIVIDPRRTDSVADDDLFLGLRPGTDTALFSGLLVHLADHGALDRGYIERHTSGFADAIARARSMAGSVGAAALATGLSEPEVAAFFQMFANTPRVVTMYSQGVNQSAQGTDKVNAIVNCHLATGRIGRPGASPFSLLPAQAWGEKSGTVTNSERCISRQRAFLSSPGETRPDWWTIGEVAKRLGFGAAFDFTSAADIFREHAALSAFENDGNRDFDIGGLEALSDEGFDTMAPVQWPIRLDAEPQARFFAEGGFYANEGKAKFIAPEIPALRTGTSAARPLRLNTGRIRDQWHTMTRTGASPRLGQHLPEPFVEVHPDDAARHGVADGDFARVTTDYGQCMLRVVVSERQQRGMLFAPIHWSEATATGARVGSLVAPHTDPFSGQPENKATPASITPYEYMFRGFALSRKPLALPDHAWWARVAVNGGYGYLLADNADLRGWQSWLGSIAGDDLAEYKDFGGGVYRAVSFAADRIETCLFIGPARDAGDWNVVKGLFTADTLGGDQRRMLLSGKSTDGLANTGPIVSACFGVGRTTICDAIAAGARSTAEIGAELKGGTNCGSCIPEMKRLIAQTAATTVPQQLATAAN